MQTLDLVRKRTSKIPKSQISIFTVLPLVIVRKLFGEYAGKYIAVKILYFTHCHRSLQKQYFTL